MACDPKSPNLNHTPQCQPLNNEESDMAIVSSYDWESDSWSHHNGDNLTRQAYREAVAEIAEKAKQTLPDCVGRVDSAVKIVLNGDVELLPDGGIRLRRDTL